ncbi:endonuclease/exonuclease/phosphatase family protein [Candidatus Saccharibacteria bacterium]|nr:endonuclease/exonuclease/phosphatase family protein [Candidatus Saccharibacteria bacterium]
MKLKILQINVWGGRIRDGLSRFIAEGDYDVVCMQEATWSEKNTGFLDLFIDTVDRIKREASFSYDFRSKQYGIKMLDNEQLEYGIVILSKIPFLNTEEKKILGEYAVADSVANYNDAIKNHEYTAQKVVLENGLVIVNYHGYWQKDPIGNETTDECMEKVAEMIRNESAPTVMCGDLNVIAESPVMRKLDFLEDLTAKNHVKTTLRNVRFVKDVACDHILVSNNVSYNNFEVIDTTASDHKALSVVIDI